MFVLQRETYYDSTFSLQDAAELREATPGLWSGTRSSHPPVLHESSRIHLFLFTYKVICHKERHNMRGREIEDGETRDGRDEERRRSEARAPLRETKISGSK